MTRRPFLLHTLLPLLLVGLVLVGLGSYFETSDDEHFAWLFSGALAAGKPVLVHYFSVLGPALAVAYLVAPQVPWYGVLNGVLLLGATLLVFRVVHQLLRPHLPPTRLAGALSLFFLLGWLEHWHWFSHVRVAALLSLGGLLLLAAGPRGRWMPGLLAVLLGCLIRPSAAGLGLLAALPAAAWLAWYSGAGWLAARPVFIALVSWAVVQGMLQVTAGRGVQKFQELDSRLALALDYQLTRPQPHTATDSLTVAAVDNWLFGAEQLVNTATLDRIYHFDARYFVAHTLPAKLQLRLPLLARDYFPLLLALAGAAVLSCRLPLARRRWYWLTQMYFAVAVLLLAGLLKLPPRLALPLLDGWLLASGAALLGGTPAARVPGGWGQRTQLGLSALAVLVTGMYLVKIGHRTKVLRAECAHHTNGLAQLHRLCQATAAANSAYYPGSPPLVLGGADDLFKSLSPFRYYPPCPVVLLTGWPSHEAGQWLLLQQLSGRPGQLAGLRLLAPRQADSAPRWLLSDAVAPVLARQLGEAPAFRPWQLVPAGELPGYPELHWYSVQQPPKN